MSMEEEPGKVMEFLLKVLVVGDQGVGKTSLVQRYVNGIFAREYKATVGVDFAYRLIQVSPDTIVRLQLWDIAGQEKYGQLTRVYYKEAFGAIIVYDVSRPSTLDNVVEWKKDIDSKVRLPDPYESPIPVILLANKCDLVKKKPDATKMDKFCRDNTIVKWFETSAQDNINVEEAIHFLVRLILETEWQSDTSSSETDGRVVQITENDTPPSNCSC
ncbi:Rab32A4 [Monocercomonoides exilis]|uniref:Rab32A4 n=1 Tax=Monocercomonoides exilis TaxID=2049356 RepID=UPI003559FF89|nr:Rab32A4 [Monocercomonoides exilis]|eukprot:MONOS_738.1-p1 / transcript=MONOS_738.1 / gene=MONOS_738 / organism=Monocercomonoides_exilis_PA203 / gene_product=Rab32A4 / transcript_product=Rab32A4 / location=Mono_scaffold00012:169363-170180(-) / protein_length=216 / sequence_SO=supercontig / SO=protein_coding / is_pseudo=false